MEHDTMFVDIVRAHFQRLIVLPVALIDYRNLLPGHTKYFR